MIAELKPMNDSRKSFYGKAIVEINGNTVSLYSYNTKICSIVNKYQFIRYWDGYGNGVVSDFDDFINEFDYLLEGKEFEELEEEEKN